MVQKKNQRMSRIKMKNQRIGKYFSWFSVALNKNDGIFD